MADCVVLTLDSLIMSNARLSAEIAWAVCESEFFIPSYSAFILKNSLLGDRSDHSLCSHIFSFIDDYTIAIIEIAVWVIGIQKYPN